MEVLCFRINPSFNKSRFLFYIYYGKLYRRKRMNGYSIKIE